MGSKGAVLSLKITGDAAGAKSALSEADGHAGKLGSGLGKLAGIAAGAFAVSSVVDFGKATFDAASNLEQMAGSVDAVFGKSAAQIDKLAANAHKAVGLSTADYDQMASIIGSQLKNAGVPADQLAGKVDGLVKQGADMSAVFGGSAADAVDALSSTLKGEFDPIEKYGVSLNQTTINAELAARGQSKLTGAALKAAQVQAALDIVTKQTAATHGQFAAQSGTAAEKSQQLGAWFDNLEAKIGAGLLPIFGALATFFTDKISPAFDVLFRKGGPIAAMFGQLGAFIKTQVVPVLSSLFKELAPKLIPVFHQVGRIIKTVVIPAFRGAWDIVQKYVIPAFRNELGPALSGLMGFWHKLSDAIEKNKGKFVAIYDKVQPFLAFMRDKVAPVIGTVLAGAFGLLGDAIGPVIDLITWVLDKAGAVLGFIGKVGGFLFGGSGGAGGATRGAGLRGASATGGGGAGPRLFGATRSLGGGGVGPTVAAAGLTGGPSTVVNITVQGAVDPMGTARQIQALLDRYGARIGTRAAVAR